MILRVHGRDPFQRLARDGRRIRRTALWCSWCPDSRSTSRPGDTSVAFALGRALGPAVTRNRLRRRLRAICRELEPLGLMPGGLLLIGAKPSATELTYAQLDAELRSLMTTLSQLTTSPPSPTPDVSSD